VPPSKYVVREDGSVARAEALEPVSLVVKPPKKAAPQDASPTVIVDLPPLFYDDHVSRDLPGGREIKRLARNTRVELDQAAYDDLVDDAKLYLEVDDYQESVPFLVISARATLKALQKVGR